MSGASRPAEPTGRADEPTGRPAEPAEPTGRAAGRLAEVRRRIAAAGGDPEQVEVVAVTKGFPASAVREALDAGLRSIGENYAQELLAKAAALGPGPARWHYLGAVQRRKVPRLAAVVSCWQSVCRVEEGEAIAGRAPGASVFAEVDLAGTAGRRGVRLADAPDLVHHLAELGLSVDGLMAVGPAGPPESARAGFRSLARLRAELGLAQLSMGMSDDLEVAVSEGSTMVRVGRALFGPRPEPPHEARHDAPSRSAQGPPSADLGD